MNEIHTQQQTEHQIEQQTEQQTEQQIKEEQNILKLFKWKFKDEEILRSYPEDKKLYDKIQPTQHRSMDSSVWHSTNLKTEKFLDGFTRRSSKREETDAKLQERGFMITTNQNPFLNNNYVKDIENQDEFLKPKITNM